MGTQKSQTWLSDFHSLCLEAGLIAQRVQKVSRHRYMIFKIKSTSIQRNVYVPFLGRYLFCFGFRRKIMRSFKLVHPYGVFIPLTSYQLLNLHMQSRTFFFLLQPSSWFLKLICKWPVYCLQCLKRWEIKQVEALAQIDSGPRRAHLSSVYISI